MRIPGIFRRKKVAGPTTAILSSSDLIAAQMTHSKLYLDGKKVYVKTSELDVTQDGRNIIKIGLSNNTEIHFIGGTQ